MIENKIILLIGSSALAFFMGCSHPRHTNHDVVEKVNRTAVDSTVQAIAPGAEYAVVRFDKGSHALSQSGREELNRISRTSLNQGRKIDDIKVLAWADHEYPAAGAKATKRDISLADDRADVIKTYFKDELRTDADVDKHNMAKRPGFFSELLKTDDAKLKENLKSRASDISSETLFTGSKESKAIVLITYE